MSARELNAAELWMVSINRAALMVKSRHADQTDRQPMRDALLDALRHTRPEEALEIFKLVQQPLPRETESYEWRPRNIAAPELTVELETVRHFDVPQGGWKCKECGESFTTYATARLHFGTGIKPTPICLK
jgi:hypothetical protein